MTEKDYRITIEIAPERKNWSDGQSKGGSAPVSVSIAYQETEDLLPKVKKMTEDATHIDAVTQLKEFVNFLAKCSLDGIDIKLNDDAAKPPAPSQAAPPPVHQTPAQGPTYTQNGQMKEPIKTSDIPDPMAKSDR